MYYEKKELTLSKSKRMFQLPFNFVFPSSSWSHGARGSWPNGRPGRVSGVRVNNAVIPSRGTEALKYAQFLFATKTGIGYAPWPAGMFLYKTLKKRNISTLVDE